MTSSKLEAPVTAIRVVPGSRVDRVVRWCRWPAAIVSLVSVPFLLRSWWYLVTQIPSHLIGFGSLILGIAIYFGVWRPTSIRWNLGDRLAESETWVTQSVIRWITRCQDEPPNWLVASSPFFVPTAAIGLATVAAMIPIPLVPWSSLALGFALAYHARAAWLILRGDRRKFYQLGLGWSLMFLPAANLLAMGLLLAMALGGEATATAFLQTILHGSP